MIPITLAELARAVGGRLAGADPDSVTDRAPVIDSRRAGPGALFVALPGEHADGHDFAADAAARGAAATLAARPVATAAVVVPNVVAALAALARHVVAAVPGLLVAGVTGSSGKTTVKDLTAALLATAGPTVAPPNSFNNEIGLPLTACMVEPDTRYLMLEYSARRMGHIAALTGVVRPHVAAVLNVGSAHLGEFGSREAIAQAKGELVEALPADGVAVLNAGDPIVAGMAARTAARVVTFGAEGADVRADDVRFDATARASFRLSLPGAAPQQVSLRYVGAHQVANALAAAALAQAAGLPAPQIARGLCGACPVSRWRMELSELSGGVLLLNDAYNANPESMAAGLRTLVQLADGRRSWAVLGEMAELGAAAPAAHAEVGRVAGELGVARVLAVGAGVAPLARAAADAGAEVAEVEDATAAAERLAAELCPGDVVLVKGSRVTGLERVAQALRGLA